MVYNIIHSFMPYSAPNIAAPDNIVKSDSVVADYNRGNKLASNSYIPNFSYDANFSYDDSKIHENYNLPKKFANDVNVADAKFHEAESMGFNPVITDLDNNEKSNRLKHVLGFNVDSYASYYNCYRSACYVLQATTPLGAMFYADIFLHKGENRSWQQKFEALSKDKGGLRGFYLGEAGLLAGMAIAMTSSEYQRIFDNLKLSLSAEFGKDQDDLNIVDLFYSQNPIIKIERNRLVAKAVVRVGSGALFAVGLIPGLLGAAAEIGAERTVFFADSPYDILVQAVNDVQYNYFKGEVAQEKLVQEMQRALQAMYADRGKNVLSEENMIELRPVLSKVADDIINRRIGVESIFGIIGGGIIVIDDAKQSEINYDFVSKNMMESVAEIAKQRRKIVETCATDKKIWDYNFIDKPAQDFRTDIATTARPHFVERERAKIAEKKLNNLSMGIDF